MAITRLNGTGASESGNSVMNVPLSSYSPGDLAIVCGYCDYTFDTFRYSNNDVVYSNTSGQDWATIQAGDVSYGYKILTSDDITNGLVVTAGFGGGTNYAVYAEVFAYSGNNIVVDGFSDNTGSAPNTSTLESLSIDVTGSDWVFVGLNYEAGGPNSSTTPLTPLTVSASVGYIGYVADTAGITNFNGAWTVNWYNANAGEFGSIAIAFREAVVLEVTGPTGPTTPSPTATWLETLPSGTSQTRYEVIVEHGNYGTVPGSGIQAYTSGVINSSATSQNISPLPAGEDFRAFVQIWASGSPSGWGYSDFFVRAGFMVFF